MRWEFRRIPSSTRAANALRSLPPFRRKTIGVTRERGCGNRMRFHIALGAVAVVVRLDDRRHRGMPYASDLCFDAIGARSSLSIASDRVPSPSLVSRALCTSGLRSCHWPSSLASSTRPPWIDRRPLPRVGPVRGRIVNPPQVPSLLTPRSGALREADAAS